MTPSAFIPAQAPEISTMLVEDDSRFAETVVGALESHPGIRFAGHHGSAVAALEALRTKAPRVLILDHHLPDTNGVDLLPTLRNEFPEMEILFLTLERDPKVIFRALKDGATGYLLKMRGIGNLPESVLELAAGHSVMSPEVARLALKFLIGFSSPARPPYGLSDREFEIVSLIARGMLMKEVAAELGITLGNAKNACHSAYRKLHVKRRIEIADKIGTFL